MSTVKEKDNFRELADLYLRNKVWFLISIAIFVILALLYTRYATDTYEVSAIIKIADSNKESGMLREVNEVNDYGLFNKDFNEVNDEVEVLRSKSLINDVVNNLNLNVRYFVKGRIKDLEIYKNPPLSLTFVDRDSTFREVDTSFVINIKSKSDFTFEGSDLSRDFGNKINTSFGNIIITPNFDQPEMEVGKDILVDIMNVDAVTTYYNNEIKISSAGENSSIIHIRLIDPVKEKARDIVDGLIKEYNQHVIENKENVVTTTSEFINNRLEVVSRELSEVDLTAEGIKKDNRLTDLSAQSNIFLQSERDIENQQVNTSTQLQLIDYMSDYLKDNDGNGDLIPANMSFDDNSINELTQKHNDLVIQRNKILESSSDKNPVVVRLNEQISGIKRSINAGLANSRSSSQIKLNALNREDSRISSKIYSAPKKERQFRDLQRQQSIKESLYLYLLEKREESAITNGISSPNAIIIDNAQVNPEPVWPKNGLLLLAALVLGFILPLIIIYIVSMLDTKIKDKNDLVNVLNIPYLGDIPRSPSAKMLIKKIDYSPKAEAFRIVRSNIEFLLKGKKGSGRVIFVTSTTAQEGKSHTSVNLALSISHSNKKTLLIETDVRVPKHAEYLDLNVNGGLTDYIVDPELKISDVTYSIEGNEHLDILPAGTIPPNPSELLMNERVKQLFEKVGPEYEYIIVDTAAVGIVTDTLLISEYADMFIYVVSANNIDKRELHVAQTLYDENRLPNMTTLLNRTTKKAGYGYGYGNNPNRVKKWWEKFGFSPAN